MPESQRRTSAQHPYVSNVNVMQNVAFIETLMLELDLPDRTLHQDCTNGFAIFGDIQPSGWWPPGKDASKPSCQEADAARVSLLKHRSEWRDQPPRCSTRHVETMVAAANDKVSRKGAVGPFTIDQVPHDCFNSHRRFTVDQPTADNPHKKRCVDDPKASGENDQTITRERMSLRGFEGLVDVLVFMMLTFPEVGLHMFAGDYEHAFEQLAIHPDQYPHMYFHVLIDGLVHYYMHTSGWFGPKAMPAAWCRVSNFIDAVLALKFAIMGIVHMDDQVCIDPHDTSASALVCFRRTTAALGFTLKKSKEKLPAFRQIGLGAEFSLPRPGSSVAEVSLPKDKVVKYSHRMEGILGSGICPPALAGKVGGYVQTINSRLWGNTARSYTWPIYDHANRGVSDVLTPRLAVSIEMLMRLLHAARPRLVQPLVCRKLLVLYFDSCGHPEHLAGILLSPRSQGQFFHSAVSQGMEAYLDPQLTDNRNTQLEALAPLLCLTTFSESLRGCDVLAYGDNQAALQSMKKGYSPSKYLCELVAGFWTLSMSLDCNIWLEWVCSEENPSDPLSRPFESPGLSYAWRHSWAEVAVVCPAPLHVMSKGLELS